MAEDYYNYMAVGIAFRKTAATGVVSNVLLAIASFCNAEKKNGECYPGINVIAARAGCSRSAASAGIKWLKDAGELLVKKRTNPNGGQTSNWYTVVALQGGIQNLDGGASKIHMGGIQSLDEGHPESGYELRELKKENLRENKPTTPNGVESASQSLVSSADSEKRKTSSLTPPSQRDGVGPWFDELCTIYPNPSRVDRKSAEREAKKFDADGPRILAAVKELSFTEQWTTEGGKYVPGLAKFLQTEQWRSVSVILTLEEARRELNDLAKQGSAMLQANRPMLHRQFEECAGRNDIAGCAAVIKKGRELAKQRLPL